MDIHKLSLVELKHLAKIHNPPIKYYYIKSRIELIQILARKDFPKEMVIDKLTIQKLRKEAREKGIENIWKLRRQELIDLLYPSSDQDNQYDNHTEKHNTPEKCEGEDIRVQI